MSVSLSEEMPKQKKARFPTRKCRNFLLQHAGSCQFSESLWKHYRRFPTQAPFLSI